MLLEFLDLDGLRMISFRSKGFDGKELVLAVDNGRVATDWDTVVRCIESWKGDGVRPDGGMMFMLRAIQVVTEVLKGIERHTWVGERGILMGDIRRVISEMQGCALGWRSCQKDRRSIDAMWLRLKAQSGDLCDEREMLEAVMGSVIEKMEYRKGD